MPRNPIRPVIRHRRRRGSHYPNELSKAVEQLFVQRLREAGSWKVKSVDSFCNTVKLTANDEQFWIDVKGLLAAAKKLQYRIDTY